jgi:hypothetical protein
VLGYILGDSFTNSSGHPGHNDRWVHTVLKDVMYCSGFSCLHILDGSYSYLGSDFLGEVVAVQDLILWNSLSQNLRRKCSMVKHNL